MSSVRMKTMLGLVGVVWAAGGVLSVMDQKNSTANATDANTRTVLLLRFLPFSIRAEHCCPATIAVRQLGYLFPTSEEAPGLCVPASQRACLYRDRTKLRPVLGRAASGAGATPERLKARSQVRWRNCSIVDQVAQLVGIGIQVVILLEAVPILDVLPAVVRANAEDRFAKFKQDGGAPVVSHCVVVIHCAVQERHKRSPIH